MKVHKNVFLRAYDHCLRVSYEMIDAGETVCGRTRWSRGLTTGSWSAVTCKNCLRLKPKKAKRKARKR